MDIARKMLIYYNRDTIPSKQAYDSSLYVWRLMYRDAL